MKISLNWIREFLDFELPPLDELVDTIGSQLGAVEEVIDLSKKYQGIRVAKVVSCEDHPNAERLHVCKIDDGGKTQDVERDDKGLVQIVCGAPNVRESLMVVWLPPGTTVPATAMSDPLVLEVRDIRGVKSNGMLASARELGIGDSHEGLLELEADVQAGSDFAETYKLNDQVIDIENKMFTHRPDCFGILGVAREIAGITGHQFTSPEWYMSPPALNGGGGLPLAVKNELPELVPRFMAVALSNVVIAPSPLWLQTYLSRLGVRPINNVVDITNYMMLLTGQPQHAYDYDKVKALSDGDTATLIVRNPHSGEKLTLLNGKEVEPRPEAIIIASDKQAIGLGGIMGGAETEVSSETKNIIVECANFDMYSIRRTSMAHGIFSDAVTRLNKGQSPLQNDRVLIETVKTLCATTKASVASPLIDDQHLQSEQISRSSVHPAVTVPTDFINKRLGLSLDDAQIEALLTHVEFSVDTKSHSFSAPFWRTDIEQREDIVEEIGRLYGYDKLPLELPMRTIKPPVKDPLLELKSKIRSVLSAAGANEVLTYSFVHGNLLEKAGQDKTQAFELGNALSPDLQYYRLSLLPSLLDKVHLNIKAGYDEFALYEIGKGHGKGEVDEDGVPLEFNRLGLVFAADPKLARQKYSGAAYYQVQKFATHLLRECGKPQTLTIIPLDQADAGEHVVLQQMLAPYEKTRSAVLHNGKYIVGVMGEFKPSVLKAFKLPDYAGGFELFLSALSSETAKTYAALPKYPKVQQDISLKVPLAVAYQQLYDFVWSTLEASKPEQTTLELSPLDIYQREEDTEHRQITLRLGIASFAKTMTDSEVNSLLDTVARAASDKLGTERL